LAGFHETEGNAWAWRLLTTVEEHRPGRVFVDEQLAVPIPTVSATMDNGILARQVEIRSALLRLVSILKARQIGTDPAIREFVIRDQGIAVSRPFPASSGLLTGRVATDESLPRANAP
jgi:hypothetical protein